MCLFICDKGTAYINAVFYGAKEMENKDGASSSSAITHVPAVTRKHILQVSTYQVNINIKQYIQYFFNNKFTIWY